MIIVDLTIRQIFRYSLLPEVSPRVKYFIQSGFGNLAYFMALVYRAVNLLPKNHQYTHASAIGTFSIRDVISTAAGNIIFDAKHIDQIILFFALIAGIIILGLQFALLLVAFLINPASAQATMPTNYAQFFTTPTPKDDLALTLLDSVFGIDNFFGTDTPTQTAFHKALLELFQFYSTGLLVIAVIIVVYFIFAILAETAQTGTPFGKRFNHVWAPLRLVAAIGLLIPIGTGLNSAQWITLHAAKFGSGFATNGWIKFNETITDTYIPADELVAEPNVPSLRDISSFMMIVHACKKAYMITDPGSGGSPGIGETIQGYIVDPTSSQNPVLLIANSNPNVFGGNTIHIVFGQQNEIHTDYKSNVKPYCGEIVLTSASAKKPSTPTDPNCGEFCGSGNPSTSSGDDIIADNYYNLVARMWDQGLAPQVTVGDGGGNDLLANDMRKAAYDMMESRLNNNAEATPTDDPEPEVRGKIVKNAIQHIESAIFAAKNAYQKEFEQDADLLKYGWGGAGIWYNKIAQINGAMTNGVMNTPQLKAYPLPMEYVCEQNTQQNENTSDKECYNPRLAGARDVQTVSQTDKNIAKALSDVFDYWQKNDGEKTPNSIISVINLILGTQELFDMCKNADIHPLAQLSSVGKGLVEAAIRNLGYALGTGAAGALAPFFGPALKAASSFLVTVASIGILIGFILYYIVPFLPFLYFLFAVGGWVKGLFEAMVGVPLWALAHIRIDGQGLPGDAAINGYFLIFEIFIRPILIVFGLLASILIFGAMVKVLNEIFSLVVSNLSGFDPDAGTSTCGTSGSGTLSSGGAPTGSIEYFRGPVDQFFFTVVYAIIVYMIAMSSFKLIDLIPNNILRWMGAGVSTFNDQAGEPAEGLLSKMAVGGRLMGGQLQGAGSKFTESVGHLGSAAKGRN